MNEPEVGDERCLNECVSECLLAEDDVGNCTPEKDKKAGEEAGFDSGGNTIPTRLCRAGSRARGGWRW